MPTTILLTGANGQLGSVLVPALRRRYGDRNVIATDLRPPATQPTDTGHIYEQLDATDGERLEALVSHYGVTRIYHLAAILSANGETDPLRTWRVNMEAWLSVLEAARRQNVDRVFYPSSIAVFGPSAQSPAAGDDQYLDPLTVYGISKAAGEQWSHYYHVRYGLDVRSLRYPGIIGYQSVPGGGTTDYAVDIFHKAVNNEAFTCFLAPDTRLPMIYMDDAIRATLELMEAPADRIRRRTAYNLSGLSLTPAELAAAIRRHHPDFRIEYRPDFRQQIAAAWPDHIDDTAARTDWNWQPAHDLESLTADMLHHLHPQTLSTPSPQ